MLRSYARRTLRALRANRYRPLNWIELNQARMIHNVQLIARQHPNQAILPVLKGNAYGHGIEQVAGILNDVDCPFLAVDGYFEAMRIRDITKHRLLVMGHILPDNARLLDTKRCSFVVQDAGGLHSLGRLGKPVSVHLELNTGMNRLGLQPAELDEYLATFKRYPKLQLEGIMSHLADADNPDDESFTLEQQRLFDQLVESVLAAGFTPEFIHLAQTAGSTKITSPHVNAIRLGIGTYGINPLAPADPHYSALTGLRPVLELKSTIIKILELRPGGSVSYNRTFITENPTRIGVLPLGYYEGLPRALSNTGCVTHGTTILPIRGRVCMNHTMVDLDATTFKTGDTVTVISSSPDQPNSIAQLLALHNLFPYATLSSLSNTIRRQIV